MGKKKLPRYRSPERSEGPPKAGDQGSARGSRLHHTALNACPSCGWTKGKHAGTCSASVGASDA